MPEVRPARRHARALPGRPRPSPAGRRLIAVGGGLAVLVALLAAYVLFPWPVPPAPSREVVAHRGVHQTFPLAGLANDTCTGRLIHPPAHRFIENTIPSMAEAFAKGATAVELDVHRTADGHLIVFHDWTLECRTDGVGTTNRQPLAYLKRLDVGYGYTADGGRTFPLRGTGVGLMPTLPEVLDAFPERTFVVNNKDGGSETLALLAVYLRTLPPHRRARLYYWGGEFPALRREVTEVRQYIFSAPDLRACYWEYLIRMLATGTLSPACRAPIVGAPYATLASVPGWPHLILARAHQAGARVFVTDVDTPEQLRAVRALPVDGIQTNRIEIIGPLLASP